MKIFGIMFGISAAKRKIPAGKNAKLTAEQVRSSPK
jgi:hypothetical protein